MQEYLKNRNNQETMRKLGLIGYPLSHSFSKEYFTQKFVKEHISDCLYNNYPIEDIGMLSDLINSEPELVGLNVTIPYKRAVIRFLNEIDRDAEEIGAVNTIFIQRTGNTSKLKGYNTDVFGFERPLLKVLNPIHKTALILGTGGASRAVAWILEKHKIDYKYVSRNPANSDILSYKDLDKNNIGDFKIIINTSPVGMYPDVESSPDLPYDGLTNEHILYDLIYNPEQTKFLRLGAQKKAITINGLPMLYLQAEKSWEIWNMANKF